MLTGRVDEGGTGRYSGTLKDHAGDPVGSGSVTALTLTLFNLDDDDKTIINSRSAQSILNTNGGTLDADGACVVVFGPSDNPIVSATDKSYERHKAVIEWTYGASLKGKTTILILVNNLRKES